MSQETTFSNEPEAIVLDAPAENAEFPTFDPGPGLETFAVQPKMDPVPLLARPKDTESAPQGSDTSARFPAIALFLLYHEYFRRIASKETAYRWGTQLPPNVKRKPDQQGNMWEVRNNGASVVLTKTEQYGRLQSAQVVIDTVTNNMPRLTREYFAWKERLPRRIQESATPSSIREAQDQLGQVREELEAMQERYLEAKSIVDNAKKIEYHFPVEAIDEMRDYDMPMKVFPTEIPPNRVQPLSFPDLDAEEFDPNREMNEKLARLGVA